MSYIKFSVYGFLPFSLSFTFCHFLSKFSMLGRWCLGGGYAVIHLLLLMIHDLDGFELLNLILFGRKTWSPIVFTLKPSSEWFEWDFNDYSVSSAGKTVIISNQPYFYKKAELFPGSAFVIGADTAARLINVRNLSAIFLRWVQNFGAALSLSLFFLGPSFFLSSWCFGQCHIFHFLVILKFLSQFLN